MAKILDGKALAQTMQAEIAADVASFERDTGKTPGLAAVLVGENPASRIYVKNNRPDQCRSAGSRHPRPAPVAETD
jgi:methylenetetrahydrofolate dehydrogenase (NADP+)/methenyltetrahydrofolate cyclohydrolase